MKTSNKILSITALAAVVGIATLTLTLRYCGGPQPTVRISAKEFFVGDPAAKRIDGNGKLQTKDFNLSDFDRINIKGWSDITIKQGPLNKADVTMDENLFQYFNSGVSSGAFTVAVKPKTSVSPSQMTKINVSAKKLNEVNLGGNIKFNITGFTTPNFNLNVGGKSQGSFEGKVADLKILLGGQSHIRIVDPAATTITLNLAGNSTVYLSGKTNTLIINAGGNATVFAKHLIAEHVKVNGTGVSHLIIHAKESITANTIGRSYIQYEGNPQHIDKTAVGAVIVEKLN